MNSFVEALRSFDKHPPKKVECNWDYMLLVAEQARLKAFLEMRDEEHLKTQEFIATASCIGNPLLRMNE